MTIKVGVIGANPMSGWAAASHIPALRALPEFSIAAVATTKRESADAAKTAFGAAHAFVDAAALADCPEVDLIVVSVKAPDHYETIQKLLGSRKPIFCEWPLGSSLAQTQELVRQTKLADIRTFVDLQARAGPVARQARDLIASGYIGRQSSATLFGTYSFWGAEVSAGYSADVRSGVNVMTVPGGHGFDLLTWIGGEIIDICAVDTHLRGTARAVDTGLIVTMTAPDQFAAFGRLRSGAIYAAHINGAAKRPFFSLRFIGDDGELLLEGDGMPEYAEIRLSGTQDRRHPLQPIPQAAKYRTLPTAAPGGTATNVAYLYQQIAADIRNGTVTAPDFSSGLKTRIVIEALAKSARLYSKRIILDQQADLIEWIDI